MSDEERGKDSIDILLLQAMVSRLHGLAITNLGTVVSLSSALMKIPDLPADAEAEAREALNTIQKQIDALTEIAEVAEMNDGR